MLPGMNGYELLDYIKTTNMPVIFITAMGTLDDKVKGLKAGADDYITKPFEMVELLARVESVLRRYHKSEERIEVDDVIIDIPSRTVTRQGEAVKLTLKEFELLLFLVRNRNIALYRETIYENIWQSEYMGDGRTVDLHLGKQLHGYDLIKDQEHMLEELLSYIKKEQPDAVLIAGDIYDRAVPSGTAMQLLEQFFNTGR